MLRQYEELSVLEQGEDGAIVSVRGHPGPSALLGAAYLEHLASVSKHATEQLRQVPEQFETRALHLLCAEVGTLIATYRETANKFYGGPPAQATLQAALEEVERLRRNLEECVSQSSPTEPRLSEGQ